jgi:hypothetical protein
MQRMRTFLRRLPGLVAVLTLCLVSLVGLLAMAQPGAATRAIGSTPAADSNAVDLAPILGLSGKLRAVEIAPHLPASSALAGLLPTAGQQPGVHPTGLEAPDGEPIHLLSLVPLAAKLGATWHGYRVGFWPGERAPARQRARYPLPEGFLEVTPADQDLRLSTHFRVRDFLTHDQQNTWPKVLVVQLPLLDKLELVAQRLETLGYPATLRIMSGFRTPQYNALGVGPRGGRARDSRHMYGDAADIFVDANGDGRMDDLDGDGRVTVNDARRLAGVVAGVEAEYPPVTGGIGIYHATALHGPFVHVDTRGTPARW